MLDSPLYADLWDDLTGQETATLPGPIVVTGASGFIGAKLLFSLLKRRQDVFGISPFPDESWRLKDVPDEFLVSADITNKDQMSVVFQKYKPKTIFHLAAYGGHEWQNDGTKIHSVNYSGTLNLIRLARENGCLAFVHAGSSSEYGRNCAGPAEDSELLPNSDYAASKAAIYQSIKFYGRERAFPIVNLRLYSVYGPFETRDRLMPRLMENALQGKLPPFVSPLISRDFVYVDDCTRAFVRAAGTACQTHKGAAINIATGEKTSLQTLAITTQKLFGITEEPKFGTMENRKWDLENWFGNPASAQALMNWKASVSLEAGLASLFRWEKEAAGITTFIPKFRGDKKISAIVACYSDASAIPDMHLRLTKVFAKIGIEYEIIFVNDCSPDGDEDIIQRLCHLDPHVVGITHSRNFGSQSAFLSGMEIATGDAIVLLDGDLQDPPEIIEAMYGKWKEGFDVVYGVRVKRDEKLSMQIAYKLFYRLFSALADIKVPKDAGDFSLIDRRVAAEMSRFRERDLFVRGVRAWVGFRQTGVPYVRPKRPHGRSTNNLLKNIWWAKKGIFSFSTKPLEYMQRLGFLLLFFTFLLSIYYFAASFLTVKPAPRGFTSMIIFILGGIALQLLSISVLGEYIGKILEEVKGRPRYIRQKIFLTGTVLDSEDQIGNFVRKRRGLIANGKRNR